MRAYYDVAVFSACRAIGSVSLCSTVQLDTQHRHGLFQGDKDMVDEMKKAFLLYDDDGTGKITFKNLERVAQELGEAMSPEELQELITEADADGDGQLSEVSDSPRDSRSAVRALTYAPRCRYVCYAFMLFHVLCPRGQRHRHLLDLWCLLLTVLSVAGRVYCSHGRAGSLLSVNGLKPTRCEPKWCR